MALIKSYEKCELKAYHGEADAAEVWTIGWGHTGPEVHPGLTISQRHADEYLKQDVQEAASRLQRKIGAAVVADLSEGQYGALVSFVFNLGIGPGPGDPKRPEWTIWKRLRARDFGAVPAQLQRFVNSNGKKQRGLVRRRAEEAAMFTSDEPLEAQPSSVTRIVETPPTPEPPKPMAVQATVTKAGIIGSGAVAAASQIKEVVEPHSYEVPVLAWVVMACTLIIVLGGLYALWVSHKQNQERRA